MSGRLGPTGFTPHKASDLIAKDRFSPSNLSGHSHRYPHENESTVACDFAGLRSVLLDPHRDLPCIPVSLYPTRRLHRV